MIQVTIGTNTSRTKVVVDPATTPRKVLEASNINYSTAAVHLDGASLKPGEMDKSFSDLGITENCYLIAVIKADNSINLSTM